MSDFGPSQELKNTRHERFAQLLASPEKRTAVECWILSDSSPTKPEMTPGRQVTSSRNSNRPDVQARVAHLRSERAALVEETELSAESVALIMAKVTEKFLGIGELAEQMGLAELAQKLRKMTVVHSGRAERLHRHAPEVSEATQVYDIGAILARLRVCECVS